MTLSNTTKTAVDLSRTSPLAPAHVMCSHPTILNSWLPALAGGAKWPEGLGVFVMTAAGFGDDGVRGVREACVGLRTRGIEAIPGASFLHEREGHKYSSWFQWGLWGGFGIVVKKLAELRSSADHPIVLDLEPYWDGKWDYPSQWEDVARWCRCVTNLFAHVPTGAKLWVAPGGSEYTTNIPLRSRDDVRWLDEHTYDVVDQWYKAELQDDRQKLLDMMELRESAATGCAADYSPGFKVKSTDVGFAGSIARLGGFTNYWVFPDGDPEKWLQS